MCKIKRILSLIMAVLIGSTVFALFACGKNDSGVNNNANISDNGNENITDEPSKINGNKITEKEWLAAFSSDAFYNCSINVIFTGIGEFSDYNENYVEKFDMSNLRYSYENHTKNTIETVGKIGDEYCKYIKEADAAWKIDDQTTISDDFIENMMGAYTPFGAFYSKLVYDDTSGKFTASNLLAESSMSFKNLEMTFADKKIVMIETDLIVDGEEQGHQKIIFYDYGITEIELPEL